MLASSSAAALLALTAGPAGAAGFVVDTPGDAGDGTCTAGSCTLRDAVDDANAAGGADVITFDPSIVGLITLTNANGEIGITDDLTITGPGRDVLAVSGNDDHRIFNIVDPIDVTISGLTLTAGSTGGEGGAINVSDPDANLALTDMAVTESYAEGDGGGVRATVNTLVVTNSIFTHNEADDDGGGLYSNAETATITGSTFSGGNSAVNQGGGLEVYGGYSHVRISDTVISGNSALYGGGVALYSDNEGAIYTTIENTTISNNTAGEIGGGAYFDDVNGIVRNTTISGNHVEGDNGRGDGGGILANGNDSDFQIVNSTISGNTANNDGGGLYLYAGHPAFQLIQSTVADNTAGGRGGGIFLSDDDGAQSLSITGTIVAANTDSLGTGAAAQDIATNNQMLGAGSTRAAKTPDAENPERAGGEPKRGAAAADVSALDVGLLLRSSLVQGSIDPNITLDNDGSNLLGVDAALAALANNGGPTQTMALNAGSPAINTGPNPLPSFPGNEFDQRGPGYARVVAGRVDIGAYEVQAVEVVVRFTG